MITLNTMQESVERRVAELWEYEHTGETTAEEAYDSVYDEISLAADGMVPIYTNEVVAEWMLIPDYDDEEYDGGFNIVAQMQSALYRWYYDEMMSALEELKSEFEAKEAETEED